MSLIKVMKLLIKYGSNEIKVWKQRVDGTRFGEKRETVQDLIFKIDNLSSICRSNESLGLIGWGLGKKKNGWEEDLWWSCCGRDDSKAVSGVFGLVCLAHCMVFLKNVALGNSSIQTGWSLKLYLIMLY